MISSCGTSKKQAQNKEKTTSLPSWINSYKNDYPDMLYLSSMGVSEYKSMAEKQAYQGIANTFEVQVSAVDRTKEVTTETAENFNQTYSEVFNITTSTDQNLINIKTSESYFDKKTEKYYILATLNKSATSAMYQKERNKVLSDAESIYTKSKTENDVLLKVAYISNSIARLEKVKIIEQKLRILDNSNMDVHKFKKIHELIAERETLLENAKVYIENNDDKIYNMLKNDFADLGFKLTSNKENALILVDFSIKMEDSGIKNQDAKFVMWYLDVNLNHNGKKQLVGAYSTKGRASQLSEVAARERAYYDIDKKISKEFTPFLIKRILRVKE